jgi:D-3-phosphoglycerate dehydrogenase
LTGAGIDLVSQKCTTDEEVVALAADADAMLVVAYPISKGVLARCPRLRVIVRYGVGVDNVDLDAATAHGVMVCNVPDYCIDEVANHAMALLLALNRRIVQHNSALHLRQRAPLAPMGPLRGEILGLIGFGRLGQAVAARGRAFGLRVIACDPYVRSELDDQVSLLPLDEVLALSDYVSVHVPLTPETKGMIGERELALMKPTAYIVSTARGGVVSEAALADALAAGEPASADNPLLAYSQVIGTPHIAYFSDESARALRRRVAEIAAEALAGGVPASVINREVLVR